MLLERAREGLQRGPPTLFPIFATLQGCLGSWAVTLLRLLRKFLLGSQYLFVSNWFILCCLEPWLMMFIVSLCSLFTPFSVSALHAIEGEHVCLEAWGPLQPCFFSQL